MLIVVPLLIAMFGAAGRDGEGVLGEFMIISSGVAAITVITRAGRLCLA